MISHVYITINYDKKHRGKDMILDPWARGVCTYARCNRWWFLQEYHLRPHPGGLICSLRGPWLVVEGILFWGGSPSNIMTPPFSIYGFEGKIWFFGTTISHHIPCFDHRTSRDAKLAVVHKPFTSLRSDCNFGSQFVRSSFWLRLRTCLASIQSMYEYVNYMLYLNCVIVWGD